MIRTLPATFIGCWLLQSAAVTSQELVDSDPLCGAYCLYVALGSLDAAVPPFDEFQEALGEPGASGFSLGELAEYAEGLGLHTLGVLTNCENLERRPGRFACIAHLARGHFVLLTDVRAGAVTMIDPPRTSSVAPEILQTQWDGTALLISAQPLLAEEDLPRERRWLWWVAAAGALGAGVVFRLFRRVPVE